MRKKLLNNNNKKESIKILVTFFLTFLLYSSYRIFCRVESHNGIFLYSISVNRRSETEINESIVINI